MAALSSTEYCQETFEAESKDLLNFDRSELSTELATSLELEPFRAKQLISWLYRRRVHDFSQMSDIAKTVREKLAQRYFISRPALELVQQSTDGTRKYLFRFRDNRHVESVLISQPTRYTLCISSQIGCAIGCKFCRTGTMGFVRNLSTAEIVGQVLAVQDDIAALIANPKEISGPLPQEFQNIVFMGMGEPLNNFSNVVRAVKILNDNLGLDFSGRKITVSTCGLVPAIKKLGTSEAKANLAVSLNATTDEVRDLLIPINKKWPIATLIQALHDYPLKKGRRITIEYVMLRGINDSKEDLKRLPQLLRGLPVKINLIPYNGNADLGFATPSDSIVLQWQKTLLAANLNSTIRWSKGSDINAACGQLATAHKTNA